MGRFGDMPNGPTMRGTDREAWLAELIADARDCARLTAWETDFIEDAALRFEQWKGDLRLTRRQLDVLERIEAKVHAA